MKGKDCISQAIRTSIVTYTLLLTCRCSTILGAWPHRPFAKPIPAPHPHWCIVYFDRLGSTSGTAEQTTSLLSLIHDQIEHYKTLNPQANAHAFNVKKNGVNFRLQLLGYTSAEVVLGALWVYDNVMTDDGARDVGSLISCEGQARGRLLVWFDGEGGEGSGLLNPAANSSPQAATS